MLVDVERARKYKINERKMYTYLKELTFSLLFFVLLLVVCYGDKSEQRYNLKDATEEDFQYFDDKGQYKVSSHVPRLFKSNCIHFHPVDDGIQYGLQWYVLNQENKNAKTYSNLH